MNMLTYEYKLYRNRRTESLDRMLREASYVWNRALALQRRYYRVFGMYISCSRMKAHFAKRSRRILLHSQTVQEVLERLDESYKRFFLHLNRRPPKFRRASDFRSIVFKQGGYKLYGNEIIINSIGKRFRFSLSRPYEGAVKQVRVKRSPLGEYYLYVVTDAVLKPYHRKTLEGASVGMDFGMKTYLTMSDGNKIDNPEFLKRSLGELRRASRRFSRTQKTSHNHDRRRMELDRLHEKVRNRREDWQWKTAHALCKEYSEFFIEDLDMRGMQKLWGRKVSDLAFGEFVRRLEHVASKYGINVYKINRFYASSKTCTACGFVNKELRLNERRWTCPICGTELDRDLNASRNIMRQGIVSLESAGKTPFGGTARLHPRISRL